MGVPELFGAEAGGTAVGESEGGVGDDAGHLGAVFRVKGATTAGHGERMPARECEAAHTGTGRAVGSVASGPEQPVVMHDDAFVEWNGHGHLRSGQDETGSLGKKRCKEGAQGGGSAE